MAQSKIVETSGATIENTTQMQPSTTNNHITETKTTDDEIKSNDNIKGDVILSLKGISEFDQLPYNKQQQKFLFMASIKAPLFKRKDERSAIDLVCVIDESGSMRAGNKTGLVKETITFLIENLTKNDRLGLVGYGTSSRIILPLTKMDKIGKEKAFIANRGVQAIHAYDNLSAGLLTGVEMIRNRDCKNMNSISSIMMLADGHANAGLTTVEQIKTAINNNGKNKELECTINTFGVGNDHDGAFLEQIANFGKGMYAYVQFNNQIGEIMAETLGGLISIIGQNLKVKIEALNDVKINKSLSVGFDTNVIKKDKMYQINIKDIQSEENRDLLFELNIPEISGVKNEFPIIQISIEYLNVIKEKKDILSIVCCINRIEGNDIGERNMGLDIQNNRLVAAEAMNNANSLAKQNKLKDARLIITNAQKLINNSKSNENNYVQALVKDLKECNMGLQSQSQYYAVGSKQLTMNSIAHYQQRSVQSQQLIQQQQLQQAQQQQLQCAQQQYQNNVKFQMVQQQQQQQQLQQLQQQQGQSHAAYHPPHQMQGYLTQQQQLQLAAAQQQQLQQQQQQAAQQQLQQQQRQQQGQSYAAYQPPQQMQGYPYPSPYGMQQQQGYQRYASHVPQGQVSYYPTPKQYSKPLNQQMQQLQQMQGQLQGQIQQIQGQMQQIQGQVQHEQYPQQIQGQMQQQQQQQGSTTQHMK